MNMDKIRNAISAFWNGKTAKKDNKELLAELGNRHDEWKATLAKEFAQFDEQHTHLLNDAKSEQILSAIHERIQLHETPLPIKRTHRIWWSAAAILLLTMFGYWAYISRLVTESAVAHAGVDSLQLHHSGPDTARYRMADGSVVELFPQSTLSYTNDYGKGNRSLALVGAAKFTVAKDTVLPFVVSANGYTTTALGTEFVVRTDRGQGVHVQLLTGKVVVASTRESPFTIASTILTPGKEIRINAQDQTFLVTAFVQRKATLPKKSATETDIALTDTAQLLVFDQAPLEQVFLRLSRQKQVAIVSDDSALEGLSFTGQFEDGEPLDAILSIICRMNDLAYEQLGDKVVVSKQLKNESNNNSHK